MPSPNLMLTQIQAEVEYAKAYLKPGRPHATRSFKRVLGDMAETGFRDVEVEQDGKLKPRPMP